MRGRERDRQRKERGHGHRWKGAEKRPSRVSSSIACSFSFISYLQASHRLELGHGCKTTTTSSAEQEQQQQQLRYRKKNESGLSSTRCLRRRRRRERVERKVEKSESEKKESTFSFSFSCSREKRETQKVIKGSRELLQIGDTTKGRGAVGGGGVESNASKLLVFVSSSGGAWPN